MIGTEGTEMEEINSEAVGQCGTLSMPPLEWNLLQKYRFLGNSGIEHMVDYAFKDPRGNYIAVIRSNRIEESIYDLIGRVHILKMEPKISKIYVICRCSDLTPEFRSAIQLAGAGIVERIEYGSTFIDCRGHEDNGSAKPRKDSVKARMRRDRIKIMMDVLSLLKEKNSRITSIIYKCNLNYRTATDLLDELIQKKYVEIRQIGNGENLYVLTKEGSEALVNVRKLYV